MPPSKELPLLQKEKCKRTQSCALVMRIIIQQKLIRAQSLIKRPLGGTPQKTCIGNHMRHSLLMPLTNLTVAEEALSLSTEDRATLARLLIQSLEIDSHTDAEIKAELNSRLEQLLSKNDPGLAFDEVFGRAP
jgi:putative addiction module component (TIGR02574 family)